jgi:hypothetical protein
MPAKTPENLGQNFLSTSPPTVRTHPKVIASLTTHDKEHLRLITDLLLRKVLVCHLILKCL